MKRAIVLAFLGLSIVPCLAYGANGYVGLYTSAERSTSAWCPFGEHSWARIEVWVWFTPNLYYIPGIKAAEFALEYPANVLRTYTEYNPDIYVVLGDPPIGVSAAFGTCQTTWFWFCHQELWVTSNAETMIRILPHPSSASSLVEVATCDTGYPVVAVTTFSHLYINHASSPMLYCKVPLEVVIGTESTSWGAIKSLF